MTTTGGRPEGPGGPGIPRVEIRRALPADATAIAALRDEAARWLLARGIEQWEPGGVTETHVHHWLDTGRVYVTERADRTDRTDRTGRGGRIVAAVRLAWEDPLVWDEQPPDAGYVHALMAARSADARGLGARLLAHVEAVITRSGRPLARLDCQADNAALRDYYRRAGYDEVGERDFPDHPVWRPVVLLEKRLS